MFMKEPTMYRGSEGGYPVEYQGGADWDEQAPPG